MLKHRNADMGLFFLLVSLSFSGAAKGPLEVGAQVSSPKWGSTEVVRPFQETAAAFPHQDRIWVRVDLRPALTWLPYSNSDQNGYQKLLAGTLDHRPRLDERAALGRLRGATTGRIVWESSRAGQKDRLVQFMRRPAPRKKHWQTAALIPGGIAARAQDPPARMHAAKPRVIATTDGEIDDQCSMVRFLLYTNEWDVEGIIHSSSKYHWKGDATHKRHNWSDESWLDRQLDAYAKVYPNLKDNDPGYPTPEYLRSRVFEGNVAYEGDMGKPTPGSSRIVDVLLGPDPSPVWLLAWGGSNTIARALKTIEEQHPERVAEVAHKARLFLISIQDNTLNTYLVKRWPDTFLILSTDFGAIAYSWQKIMSPDGQRYFDAKWMKKNILSGHGPLCALYRAHADGRFRSEGDSPSFLHLIDVGLDNSDHPSWGGWGGRFVRRRDGCLHSAVDDGPRDWAILRWAKAFQNDWAARAAWCVKPFAQCNHAPKAVCNGDRSRNAVIAKADPDAEVRLDASGSSDPDGNRLRYKWWVYKDAGDYWAAPPIRNAESATATLRVPRDAAGRTIHTVLEVTDDGKPPLTAYRRVVIHVSGKPQPSPRERYLTTPVTHLQGPPSETGPWTFYRGIDLNGPAVKIDGNQWEGKGAPNIVCTDRSLISPGVSLRPPTDPARATMIHSFRWNSSANVTITRVPAGTYAVYVYVWEDNNPETLAFSLNGKSVVRNHVSGIAGEWHRLGPWSVRVADGKIHIAASNGAANLSGIEIWKRTP